MPQSWLTLCTVHRWIVFDINCYFFSISYKLVEFKLDRTFHLFICIAPLVVIMVCIKREVSSTWIDTHSKLRWKCLVFMFIIITTHPIQRLLYNFIIIYIIQSNCKVRRGLCTIKCISQLKTKFNFYHHIVYLNESKSIGISF